jgi:hypothetical protein
MDRTCSVHGEKRNTYMITVETPEENNRQEDLVVDCRILLKYILEKQDWMLWTGAVWLGIVSIGGLNS